MDMYNGLSMPPLPDKLSDLKDVEDYVTALNQFLSNMMDKTKQFYIQPRQLTATQITAMNNPVTGDLIYNSTTKKLNFYNGTTWVVVTSV